jgi:hypothetical protein
MREIAALAVAALIPIGVGSFGSDVSNVREAVAATEAGINTTVVPAVPDGIDPFGLMVSARDLPMTHYDQLYLAAHYDSSQWLASQHVK